MWIKRKIFKAGNVSKSVIIPKVFFDVLGLKASVEMTLKDNHIIIRKSEEDDKQGNK